MPDHLWYKHYAKDWIGDPELRLCSPAARGLLIDIMSLCHLGKPYGYLLRRDGRRYSVDELCEILHYRPKQFLSLRKELFRRRRILKDRIGIYVPRMVKEKDKLDRFSEYGKRGGNPDLKDDGPIQYTEGFNKFWRIHPRPSGGKKKCFEEWNKALEGDASEDTIIMAAERYREATKGKPLEYIKTAPKWIEGGGWDDIPDTEQEKRRRKAQRKDAAKREYEKAMTEFVSYVEESSKESSPRGGTIQELIERIAEDVEKQFGEKGKKDFENRVESFKTAQ